MQSEGTDVIDLARIRGDILSRRHLEDEASEVFSSASRDIQDLEQTFIAIDALTPSPKKTSVKTKTGSTISKELLLPMTMAHILRQQAWLLRESGTGDVCEQTLHQIVSLSSSSVMKADNLYLDGRMGLHEAFKQFKTDLFMSSLTESSMRPLFTLIELILCSDRDAYGEI